MHSSISSNIFIFILLDYYLSTFHIILITSKGTKVVLSKLKQIIKIIFIMCSNIIYSQALYINLNYVISVKFSPNGITLASGSNDKLILFLLDVKLDDHSLVSMYLSW